MQQTLVLEWAPATGSTPGTAIGWGITANGTASHPALASTNLQTQMRRTRFTSATTTNAAAGLISADALCWLGNAAGLGGFMFSARFSISTNVAASRAFIGLSASSTSMVSAEPSSFANSIGVGFDSTDSSTGNWQLIRMDGTTSAKVDLGSAAPRNTADVYEITIHAASNASEVRVSLVNLSTAMVVLEAVAYSTNIPVNSAFLYTHAEVGPAGSGTAMQLDVGAMSFKPKKPVMPGFYDLQDYGGVPDWNGTKGTDNLPAWIAMMAAIKASSSTGSPMAAAKIVAHGAYYFGGTLHIEQTVHICGSGMNFETVKISSRSDAATMFVFPANIDGIRIHSTMDDDAGAARYCFLKQAGKTTTLTGGSGYWGSSFTADCVGKPITISGSSTSGNNGTFTICTFIDSDSVSWENAAGATDDGATSGSAASLTKSGAMMTLTGGSGFTTDMVGRQIRISGSTTSTNNGIFIIASYVNATSVTFRNELGAIDTSNSVNFGVGQVFYTRGGGFASGQNSFIEDLTLYCKDYASSITGCGVHATIQFYMRDVWVQGFGDAGVWGNGAHVTNTDGNVDGMGLSNVKVGDCDDGFRFEGADATGGVIINCEADQCRRYGFYDASRMNTYVAGLAQNGAAVGLKPPNRRTVDGSQYGSNYHTEGSALNTYVYNSSVFIGCYSEGSTSGRESRLFGAVDIIGGTLTGDSYIHSDSTCFIVNHGEAIRAPYRYVNYRGTDQITTQLGSFETDEAAMDALVYSNDVTSQTHRLRYTHSTSVNNGWWMLQDNSYYRQPIRYPTQASNVRTPAPWCMEGVILGRDDNDSRGHVFTAETSVNQGMYNGTASMIYDVGDTTWNPGNTRILAWRCSQEGSTGTLNGGSARGSISSTSNVLTVNNYTGITIGCYLTIEGVNGVKRVTAIDYGTLQVTLSSAADATVGPNAHVDYSPPVHDAVAKTGGQRPISMSDADYAVSDAEAAREILNVSATLTANRNFRLPAPDGDQDAYQRTIRATGVSGGALLVDIVGGTSPVTVAAGKTAILGFDASGAFRVSPDV